MGDIGVESTFAQHQCDDHAGERHRNERNLTGQESAAYQQSNRNSQRDTEECNHDAVAIALCAGGGLHGALTLLVDGQNAKP